MREKTKGSPKKAKVARPKQVASPKKVARPKQVASPKKGAVKKSESPATLAKKGGKVDDVVVASAATQKPSSSPAEPPSPSDEPMLGYPKKSDKCIGESVWGDPFLAVSIWDLSPH